MNVPAKSNRKRAYIFVVNSNLDAILHRSIVSVITVAVDKKGVLSQR